MVAAVAGLVVGAAAPAAAASTAAQQTTDEADATVAASELEQQAFFGQVVAVQNVSPRTDGTVQLRRGDADDSTFVGYYDVDDSEAITIDTAELDHGTFVIRDADGDRGPFEVDGQDVEFAFADESVGNGGDVTALDWVDDNRGQTVDLRIDAGGELGAGELERVFAAADASAAGDGSDAVIVEDVTEGDQLEVEFGVEDVGEYEFTVEVLDTGATDDATITVDELPIPRVQWAQDTVTEDIGDVAEFELSTRYDTDEVWFTIVDDRGAFDVTVQVTNVDRDEPIEFSWNTHHARNESANVGLSAENADVNVTSAEGQAFDGDGHLSNREDGWSFDLEAFRSEEKAAEDDFADILLVELEQRETGDLTTYTAPGVDSLSHDDDIEDVLAQSTERHIVADGDLLIAEIEVSGVFGYLETDPTEFASDGLEFQIVGEAPAFGAGVDSNVSELAPSATVVDRPEENAIYVAVDAGEIPEIEDGEALDAEFSIDGAENPYVDDSDERPEQAVSDPFTFETREVEIVGDFHGDRLLLPAEESVEITATTNLAPNTDVDLHVGLPADGRNAIGTVTDDGNFSAVFDLADVEPGTHVRPARVRVPNAATDHSVRGVVYDPDGATVVVDAESPENASAGDATLDVTVSNVGGAAGSSPIDVTVDGERALEETVELGAGEAYTAAVDLGSDDACPVAWTARTRDERDGGYRPSGDGGLQIEGDCGVSRTHVVGFVLQHLPAPIERTDPLEVTAEGSIGQHEVVDLFAVLASEAGSRSG